MKNRFVLITLAIIITSFLALNAQAKEFVIQNESVNMFVINGTTGNILLNPNTGFGNVGIGATLSPYNTLTVIGSVGVSGSLNASSINTTGGAYFATSSGNVGIGTTTPGMKLVVAGNANITGSLFASNVTLRENGSLYQPVYGTDDDLVMYLPFDRGNVSTSNATVHDRSPYGYDGQCYGNNFIDGCNWTSGKYGNALFFDGVNDYVSVGTVKGNFTDLTFSAWINYPDTVCTNHCDVIDSVVTNYRFRLYIESTSGEARVAAQDGGAGSDTSETTGNITGVGWTHIAAVKRGSSIRIYVNGLLNVSGTFNSNGDGVVFNDNAVYIGSLDGSSQFARGSIDEVMIYKRALAPEEIRTHYLRGKGFGASGAITADKFRVVNTTGGRVLEINQSAFAVHTAGSERLKIDSTGNVGIGTTSPLNPLHVVGAVTLAGGVNASSLNVTGFSITDDSLVTLSDGTKKKIKDVNAGEEVLTLDEKTGKLVAKKVNALLDHGIKPIYEMTTEDGRAINTTGEHPYLVKLYSKELCDKYAGNIWNKEADEFNDYCTRWVEVKDLNVGDYIAVPKIRVSENHFADSNCISSSATSGSINPFIRIFITNAPKCPPIPSTSLKSSPSVYFLVANSLANLPNALPVSAINNPISPIVENGKAHNYLNVSENTPTHPTPTTSNSGNFGNGAEDSDIMWVKIASIDTEIAVPITENDLNGNNNQSEKEIKGSQKPVIEPKVGSHPSINNINEYLFKSFGDSGQSQGGRSRLLRSSQKRVGSHLSGFKASTEVDVPALASGTINNNSDNHPPAPSTSNGNIGNRDRESDIIWEKIA